ncbi:hypothetical protein [Paracoccus jiaweipingae]|uniref:hypothetical protein n=1 Tax=unclassified Paracoccus (in: a-proteobacteria) TaxID=2688777 RepID=UPI0037AA0695
MNTDATLANFQKNMQDMQTKALKFQTEMNTRSMLFNSAMAAKDAEKKAWDKVHG